MTDVTPHDVEVKELYEKISVEIPGGNGLRAMSLEGFQVAIDKMMNKAYAYGTQQAFSSVEDVVDRVFKR